MSAYTITSLEVYASGGVGIATYRVTLTDGTGRFADTGAAFSSAYSDAPGMAADGSTRSTNADGSYIGMGSFDLAPLDSSLWLNPSLGPDDSGNVSPIGGFSPGLVGDATAIATIQSAASDAAVVSAATAALAAGSPPFSYAISVNITLPGSFSRFGSDSGSAGLTSSGSGDPHATLYSPETWTTSNTAICTIDTSSGAENPRFIGGGTAGSCTVTLTVGSPGGVNLHASGTITTF